MSERYLESRKPRYNKSQIRRRQIVAGTALLAVMAGVGAKAADLYTSPAEKRQEAETSLLETMRTKEAATAVDNSVLILRAGTKYRSTPDMIKPDVHSGEEGNVSGSVKKGQVLVVERPLKYQNEDGVWLGFKLSTDESNAHKDASDVAKDMHWVNLSVLGDQRNSDGDSFYERFDAPQEDLSTARIDANGNIELGEGQLVAQAKTVGSSEAEFMLNALGVRNHG